MVCFDEGGRGRRAVRLIAAPPNLRPWVEHFFIQARSTADTAAWRVVPDASAHVILSVANRTPRCHMVGSRTTHRDIDTSGRTITVGARLRAGAASYLARCAATELTDRSYPAGEVFGAPGRELGDRIAEQSPHGAVDVLSRFLTVRFKNCRLDTSLDLALRSAGSVEAASAMLGIPLRTLRARVENNTGLAPKRVLRIRRLYRALRYLTAGRHSWSDLACRAGYADQAHMVREFRGLLGETPESWRRRAPADSFNTPAGHLR